MRNKTILAAMLVVALASAATAQDARTAIAAASKAMGADTLNTVEYPGAALTSRSARRTAARRRGRSSSTRPTHVRSISAFRPRRWTASACRARTRRAAAASNPSAASSRRTRRSSSTQTPRGCSSSRSGCCRTGFLRAAAAEQCDRQRHKPSAARSTTVVTFTGQNKAMVNGYINDQNLVERVETWIDNAGARRHAVRSRLYRLQGLRRREVPNAHRPAPGRLSHPRPDDQRCEAKCAGHHSAPQGRAGGAPAAPHRQPAAAAYRQKSSATAIYLILGGYASVAVDLKDHIVVIEGPTKRRARQRDHRRSEAADSEQADSLRRQHASALRSLRRPARRSSRRVRRSSRIEVQQAVLRESVRGAAHVEPRHALRRTPRKPTFETDDATRRC